jgi:eukaryotic-like serine/threonine-protein kinase
MAVVMLARDTSLDRPVAVKLLADRLEDDVDLRKRFLREGRFAAQLSHPNVVAVYDTGEHETQPYIVMECVEGVSLAEELQLRGRLPAEEVIQLGRQACAGLEHAHARGLVHRDVKPQNLLLREDGTLKVADFGIARLGDGSTTMTKAGTLIGTAAYMAPEVVHGEPATPAADLYSLGAVLYELLTGRPPRGTALAELASREPPAPPSASAKGVPPHLDAAIMRCLDADPAGRPDRRRSWRASSRRPPRRRRSRSGRQRSSSGPSGRGATGVSGSSRPSSSPRWLSGSLSPGATTIRRRRCRSSRSPPARARPRTRATSPSGCGRTPARRLPARRAARPWSRR